jgi:hypothetical protein
MAATRLQRCAVCRRSPDRAEYGGNTGVFDAGGPGWGIGTPEMIE